MPGIVLRSDHRGSDIEIDGLTVDSHVEVVAEGPNLVIVHTHAEKAPRGAFSMDAKSGYMTTGSKRRSKSRTKTPEHVRATKPVEPTSRGSVAAGGVTPTGAAQEAKVSKTSAPKTTSDPSSR